MFSFYSLIKFSRFSNCWSFSLPMGYSE